MTVQAQQARNWAQINEASFVAGMHFLFWVCRIFGRWPFRIMLYPVLAWYLLMQPQARAASSAYLRRVRDMDGVKDVRADWRGVMQHFAAFAECILDKMLLWSGVDLADGVRFFGEGMLEEDIVNRRGGLLICSHFGNLELCRVLARRRAGLKMTVLVHTKHAQKFNRLLAKLDPQSQLDLLQVTELSPVTAMLLNERVMRGEFVVIAGDRVPVTPGMRTCRADFLGGQAAFPVGPYLLAGLLQCPIYMLFSMQVGNHAEVHFERLSDPMHLPRRERDAMFAQLAQAYVTRLEHFCLRAPFQWFNFYDFWQSTDTGMTDAFR